MYIKFNKDVGCKDTKADTFKTKVKYEAHTIQVFIVIEPDLLDDAEYKQIGMYFEDLMEENFHRKHNKYEEF
jgi:hypothetical protein